MTTQIAPGNESQAEFWKDAGSVWEERQAQLDGQIAVHGGDAIDAGALRPGERVLDVGCGTGSSTVELASRVAPDGEVLGIDISPTMAEAARNRLSENGVDNASVLVSDAQQHQLEADAYDVVFSRFGVMFFSDPGAAFTNLHRAQTQQGRLAFVCWQKPTDNPWMTKPMQAVRRHIDSPGFGSDPTAPGPFSFADPARIEGILTDAGYRDVVLRDSRHDIRIGASLEDATDFAYRINGATSGLDQRDPPLAAAIRASITDALEEHRQPEGVYLGSATWIVTANA